LIIHFCLPLLPYVPGYVGPGAWTPLLPPAPRRRGQADL